MFFSRDKESKNILLFDIGTSSINSFLVLSRSGMTPELLAQIRLPLPLLENPDFRHLERHTRKAIKEISEYFRKNYPKTFPEMVLTVLSQPWYLSETKLIKIARRESFPVTTTLINDLLDAELELSRKRAMEQFEAASDGIQVLEEELIGAAVNGYPTKELFGKFARQFEIALYISLANKNFIQNLSEILKHFFGKAELHFASEPLALFKVLSKIVNPKEGFIVVDVGGELTEIYLVRNGVLENVSSFKWGGNIMVRRLASLLKIDLGEVFSFFRTKSRGELRPGLNQKLDHTMSGVCFEWKDYLFNALSKMAETKPLPQTIFLFGGMAGSEVLKGCIKSEELSSFTVLGKPFNVLTFLPENLENRIVIQGIDRKDPQMTLPLLLIMSADNYAWERK